jgi:ABC-type multidrug transport system ATPase subunit/pSer/pThr/pTyr-binding forkhead associated (FHA) protein
MNPQQNRPVPSLLVRIPGQSPWEVRLEQDGYAVGRKTDNDIVLPHGYVSGHHGRLERRGDVWHYQDLNSTNGTFVNGKRVQEATLRDGDIIRIGDLQGNSVSLTFRAAGVEPVVQPAPSIVHMGLTTLGTQDVLVIGRDPQSDIHIPEPTVSWRHARLERVPEGHILTDLNSTNGTFVNGRRITAPYLLRQGDEVQIGPHRLVYEVSGLQQYVTVGGMRLDGLGLVWESGRGKRKRQILKGVDISIYPREFVALVGASGAGKTTLLKALNGFTHAQGRVLVNGDDLYHHFDQYRTMLGYVPQDDIIHRELTVASALRYAARLRLPPDTSDEEIEQRIDSVLQEVGMVEQKHNPITRLSGGQRKRVNMAVELLAEPRLFFLDEPTSGLDPGLEKKMMHTLRHLADGGRTVVLVTHATANITQCDHICFLAHGRVVYFGPPEEALAYFGVTSGDFADIYDLLDDPDPARAREKAAEYERRFKESPQYQQYVASRLATLKPPPEPSAAAPARRRPKVNPLRQFAVLTQRNLDLVLRDRLLLGVLLAVMPVIALLLLLIAKPNWLVGDPIVEIERQLREALGSASGSASYAVAGASQTLLFMLALAAVLLGLFAAAYEVVKERSVFLRERMINLRLLPYLGAKFAVLGGFAMVQCLLLLVVLGWGVRLPQFGVVTSAPVEMYVTLLLGTLAALAMGLFISAVVPNTNSVIYIVLLVLFFQIIFAGVFFNLPGPAGNLSYLTLSRWTVEGLGTSVNLDWLNNLTRTRFQPPPISREVHLPVALPAPPTVVTETQQVAVVVEPGITRTVPISVPRLLVSDPPTVTRVIVQPVTVTPDPVDIQGRYSFQLDYTRTPAHLYRAWGVLLAFTLAFAVGAAVVLEAKDVW